MGEYMKKLTRLSVFLMICAVIFCQNLSAEEANEEEIELPDVTTVISGGALTAGKDSVPEYKNILPDLQSGSVKLPELGSVQGTDSSSYSLQSESYNKSVYAEGKIGGGFPLSFVGDFSIYRTTGNSPFALSFFHESNEGVADNKARKGYFFRTTGVTADKEFNFNSGSNKFSAKYITANNGLQSQSSSFTDEVLHNVDGIYDGTVNLSNGVFFEYGTSLDFHNRYGTTYNGADTSINKYEDTALTFDFSPNFGFGWHNEKVKIGFNMAYSSELNLKDTDTLLKAEGSSSSESSHRGQFTINSSYNSENFGVWAKAQAVIGSAIGDNNVIVPFALGSNFSFNSGLSSQNAKVILEGGCDSYENKISAIERSFYYTICSAIPTETTDWYAKADISLPVKDIFNLNLAAEYRKTAFGNGIWAPDYNDGVILASGYYVAEQKKHTEFNSKVEFSAVLARVKLTGAWNSCWIDVPSLENEHSIRGTVLYQSENSRFAAEVSAIESISSGIDAMPKVDGSISVKASDSIRLALEVNDVIKLVTNDTRTYCGSKYKAKGGNALFIVKFQF